MKKEEEKKDQLEQKKKNELLREKSKGSKQETKLKPVIFVRGKYNYHKDSLYKQNLLLKAMQQTSDVTKMQQLTGIRTVAEVYRTLDKIAMRKDYHQALIRQGIDLDTIIVGIKQLCVNSNSDSVKLSGYKTFLKSLGLDEYKEDNSDTGKNWEEKMRTIVQKEIDSGYGKGDGDVNNNIKTIDDYEVITPEVPEDEQIKRDNEKEEGVSIYE